MASIYFQADDEITALVKHIQDKYHQELTKAKVEVGVLFAISTRENQPALKEHGQKVEGTIKIVSPKDKVTKKFDAEMILDGDEWKTNQHRHKVGTIDHLLYRLEVKKPKVKKKKSATHGSDEERQEQEDQNEFVVDDGGRPVLKMRKSDIYVGAGYREVMIRNGGFAPERRAIESAMAVVDACEMANNNAENSNLQSVS